MAKERSRRKTGKQAKGAGFGRRLPRFLFRSSLLLLLAVLALVASYAFGSLEQRRGIERTAINLTDPLRLSERTPALIAGLLNRFHDRLPSSVGFYVDGGELERAEGALLAGVPESPQPLLLLWNQSYVNLYNEAERHAACLAFRALPSRRTTGGEPMLRTDSRVPGLTPQDALMGPWVPTTLLPVEALAGHAGVETAAREAHLATALFPVKPNFADRIWFRLMRKIATEYPRRFGEIWILCGPLFRTDQSKLSTGVPLPDAFFAVALDLTDEGGLRALSFIVPVDAKEDQPLSDFLSSIETVERHSGLQLLPQVRVESLDPLRKWCATDLW